MSISFTTQASASAAFLGFVMMGVMRCGTPGVRGELDALRVDQHHAHLGRLRAHEQRW